MAGASSGCRSSTDTPRVSCSRSREIDYLNGHHRRVGSAGRRARSRCLYSERQRTGVYRRVRLATLVRPRRRDRFIAPGALRENGYIESFNIKSFNGTLISGLLSREVFGHLLEARVLGTEYCQEYNSERPPNSLNYQTPEAYSCELRRKLCPHPDTGLPFTRYRNRGHLNGTNLTFTLVQRSGTAQLLDGRVDASVAECLPAGKDPMWGTAGNS